jgi:beta-glucosidase-like glycosyl hydrolase
MIKNTHLRRDTQNISKEDLELFEACFKKNISAVMIGHQISEGLVNSKGKPSSVSPEVISSLKNFSGLVISDEINMLGLRSFYYDKTKLYMDLINSGENLILDFRLSPVSAYNLIVSIEKEVTHGKISKEKIDESAEKILEAKGYKVN